MTTPLRPDGAAPATDNSPAWERADPLTRHNLTRESLFSACNGVFLGLAIVAAPAIAVVGPGVSPIELTVLVSAFPVGAFLGPLWASLGRRWGMKKLVTRMAVGANLPLFVLFWSDNTVVFTVLITISQLLNAAMRMGQSSLYGLLYARPLRGRVLGRLTLWTYLTMVPSILLTGWLLNRDPELYHVLYPLAGLSGLAGCWFYGRLRLPAGGGSASPPPARIRERMRAVQRVLREHRAWLRFQASYFLAGSAFFMSTHVVLLLVRDEFGWEALKLSVWLFVVPQMLLAAGSPFWGRLLDRLGIVSCRLLIGLLMTAYLGSYFLGIMTGVAAFIFLGSLLQGLSNAGGQLTWALASTHFAPSPEDVPLYSGMHFVFNGVRGLVMPWVGALLLFVVGPWSVLAAMFVACASVPVVFELRSKSPPGPREAPAGPLVPAEGFPNPAAMEKIRA